MKMFKTKVRAADRDRDRKEVKHISSSISFKTKRVSLDKKYDGCSLFADIKIIDLKDED